MCRKVIVDETPTRDSSNKETEEKHKQINRQSLQAVLAMVS